MNLGIRYGAVILLLVIIAGFFMPAKVGAEDFKLFTSEEYGFTMKYPATWVKVEPSGNYYVVFQAPDLIDNFRSRIHVAAHKPVKDPINVFLQELRNGIADLQKKGSKDSQEVKILDEGEFKSDVPGAYYFFLQALDNKLKVWMDIVIVFFKHEQTLLRISCLAPSQSMEKFQPMFNDVLLSVKFADVQQPVPSPSRPQTMQAPSPTTQMQPSTPPTTQPQVRPSPPTPGMLPTTPQSQARPTTPGTGPGVDSRMQTETPTGVQSEQPIRQIQPAPPPRPTQRGPLREPERPSTGIVN